MLPKKSAFLAVLSLIGCTKIQRGALLDEAAQPFRLAMSITKRYFTSLLSMRS